MYICICSIVGCCSFSCVGHRWHIAADADAGIHLACIVVKGDHRR